MFATRTAGWLIDHLPDVAVVPTVALITGAASWLYAATGYAPSITRKENPDADARRTPPAP